VRRCGARVAPEPTYGHRRAYVWEVVLSALAKLSAHVNKLRRLAAAEEAEGADEAARKCEAAETVQRSVYLSLVQVRVCGFGAFFQAASCRSSSSRSRSTCSPARPRAATSTRPGTARSRAACARCCCGCVSGGFVLQPGICNMYAHPAQQDEEYARYAPTMERLLFTSDIDPHLLEVFHQFCALRR